MTSKPWMPLYIADYLADTASRGGNLQQTQGRGAAPATPKPSVGSPLISDTAFKLASEIVRLCGHRDDFLPPSWAGAPMHVQDVWDALPRHSASKTRVNALTSE